MRVCPKCNYHDEPYWRPAKMNNPSGDTDIARIDDLTMWQPNIAEQLLAARGIVAEDECFAYLFGKRGVWVKRVSLELYHAGGISAFKQPFESSKHNPLALRVSGRTRTTFRKIPSQTKLLEIKK